MYSISPIACSGKWNGLAHSIKNLKNVLYLPKTEISIFLYFYYDIEISKKLLYYLKTETLAYFKKKNYFFLCSLKTDIPAHFIKKSEKFFIFS